MTPTMHTETPEIEELIERAGRGSDPARQALLVRHRARLRRMVAVRMDQVLAARVDPSDVVQEVLAEAHRTLDGYLRDRPLPFYPWLRRLAWERLAKLHRHHVGSHKRNLLREEAGGPGLPDRSAMALAERLLGSGTSPSRHLLREEMRDRVRAALQDLDERDREVLVLRFLEGVSTAETGVVLGIGEGAVKSRLMRALARFRDLLDEQEEDGR
jgi:RNA polymerase sigma-70 factor (ECF subfamily)